MAGKITAVIFCSAFYLTLTIFYNTIPVFISSYSPKSLVFILSVSPRSPFPLSPAATLVPQAHCEVYVSDRHNPGSLLRMFMPAFA